MHVNLILDEEKRSASPVSLGLVIRLAGLVVLVLALIGIFSFTSSYRDLKNEAKYMKEEWAKTESKYKDLQRMRDELATKIETSDDIEGWRNSRMAWGPQMDMMQSVVPAVIQLTELRVGEAVPAPGAVVTNRVYEMKLTGRTPVERSEANVMQLLEALKAPPFREFVESSTLPAGAFRQDPMDKFARSFNIVLRYLPRPMP